MELIDNLDWTAYTLRTVTEDTVAKTKETFVYVHTEYTFGGDEPRNLCEECSMEQNQDEAEKHYEEFGVFPDVPHVPGMRYWYSMEVGQSHDWPHQDSIYCGMHMRVMADQNSDPEAWTPRSTFHHYNTPSVLLPK